MSDGALRNGDLVEVRGPAEILQTLDANGCLDGLPFMPEMASYCGRRFRVDRRAEKVCDTVTNSLQSRRLPDTVLLDDLRCNGHSHGGCQAECRFYWKETWLRRADGAEPARGAAVDADAMAALLAVVGAAIQTPDRNGRSCYRCQATEAYRASTPLSTADPRPYLRELSTRNTSARVFVRVMSRAVIMQPLQHFGRLRTPVLKGMDSTSPKSEPLDLQPGEWVRVKSPDEVRAMLTDTGSNRGLWFDREMLAFCGQVMRVRGRVTRIINEGTGEMIELKSDCIKLENGICSGERSPGRWFCPREIYSYWRECWLERVEAPGASVDEEHELRVGVGPA